VAECPARAITLKHSTDEQIEAKIDALLQALVAVDDASI
jgi:hypothetical protein